MPGSFYRLRILKCTRDIFARVDLNTHGPVDLKTLYSEETFMKLGSTSTFPPGDFPHLPPPTLSQTQLPNNSAYPGGAERPLVGGMNIEDGPLGWRFQ